MHFFNLRFADPNLEIEFNSYTFKRELAQGRAAIVVGSIVYAVIGGLDFWYVAEDVRPTLMMIRAVTIILALCVAVLSFRPFFERVCPIMFSLSGLFAGTGLLVLFAFLEPDVMAAYYPGLIMVAFFTYNFVGTRYVYALTVDLLLLVTYNILAVHWGYETSLILTHDVYLISVNMIGGTLGYMTEHNRRSLFLRERQLEQEKAFHKELAQHDPLTGLLNRRAFFDFGYQTFESSRRYKHPLTVMMMDLDHFKEINDVHGHSTGDQALTMAAHAIRETLRESDIVGRVGGEEFAAILPETPLAGVLNLAERVRLSIANQNLEHNGRKIEINISIGIADAENGEDLDAVLANSDKALLHAKQAGRNRVVSFDEKTMAGSH